MSPTKKINENETRRTWVMFDHDLCQAIVRTHARRVLLVLLQIIAIESQRVDFALPCAPAAAWGLQSIR
jgi:hypothetical protein